MDKKREAGPNPGERELEKCETSPQQGGTIPETANGGYMAERGEETVPDYFSPVLSPDALRAVSSLGLAHMGDAVFELLVRSWLCVRGKATGRDLHRACIKLVCAESQAVRAERILPLLTEEESAVFRRGRNAQPHTVPAHASRAQYGEATALEALLGWLYLRGERDRISRLFAVMMEGET